MPVPLRCRRARRRRGARPPARRGRSSSRASCCRSCPGTRRSRAWRSTSRPGSRSSPRSACSRRSCSWPGSSASREGRRGLLIAVYAVTAAVSIAFSYVSLHTWFASRERPATIERALYDELNAAAGQSQELLTAALAEGQKHVLALEEMTTAEKAHGYISRATDQDPYLARVREAVAREAESYGASYPEGQGSGLRYTAFDRHAAPRPADGRPPPGVAAGARRLPRGPEAARPDRAAAARLPAGLRRASPGATCARRCTPRSRCPRCPPTPTSWTARPRGRRTW